MELDDLQRRLDSAASRLSAAAAALGRFDPGPQSLGAAAPGRLGDLGRALSTQLTAALDAHERQAGAAAGRLGGLATDMRAATAAYGETDAARAAAARDHGGE